METDKSSTIKENRTLKVLALQYCPVYKDIKASMEITNEMLESYTANDKVLLIIYLYFYKQNSLIQQYLI